MEENKENQLKPDEVEVVESTEVKPAEVQLSKEQIASKELSKLKPSGLVKFANFLLTLSILGFGYSLFASMSILALGIVYIFAVVILLLTLFTVNWLAMADQLASAVSWMFTTVPYFLYASIGCGVVALLVYIFKKNISKTAKIITVSIFLVLNILLLLLHLSGKFTISF